MLRVGGWFFILGSSPWDLLAGWLLCVALHWEGRAMNLETIKKRWNAESVNLYIDEIDWLITEVERLQGEMSLEKQTDIYNLGWNNAIKAVQMKLTIEGLKGEKG